MERGISARLTASEGRKFAFTVGAAFLVLAGIVWWRGHTGVSNVVGGVGAVLVLAGLVVPGRLGPVYRGWMRFALLLSKVTTPIFMGITYFLILTPTGILRRLLGRNPVVREARDGSYWVSRPEAARKSDIERQF